MRFLLQPLFQIPQDQGTHWVSLTIMLPIIMMCYSVAVALKGGTFRDLLALAAWFALSGMLFVILGIAIDDFGGIETYYTVQQNRTLGGICSHMWSRVWYLRCCCGESGQWFTWWQEGANEQLLSAHRFEKILRGTGHAPCQQRLTGRIPCVS